MLIDWFTVGAQVLNFLILVGLLRHFLYRPVLHAIAAREKTIAAEGASAAALAAEAAKERDAFRLKNDGFDRERAGLLSRATGEADAERERLLGAARQAADALAVQRREALASDLRNLAQSIELRVQQEVFAIARRTLTDLGGASLEQHLSSVFISRLRELPASARDPLGVALAASPDPARVRSAFALPAAGQADVQAALQELFSPAVRVRFEVAPELIGGIELLANGQKAGWSVADYLQSLEKAVGQWAEADHGHAG